MKRSISIIALLAACALTLSAEDFPKATGHMNDTTGFLPEIMVKHLEISTAGISRDHRLNFVIMVVKPPHLP